MIQFVLILAALAIGAGVALLLTGNREPRRRIRSVPALLTRELRIKCRAVEGDENAFEFVGATENPVDMGEDMPEVLRMDGASFQSSVPLLDAHDRKTADCVLGRAFPRRDGRQLAFRAVFSDATERARNTCALVRDRAIDACSVGYIPDEVRQLREGETDGEGEAMVKGPCYVVTKWRVMELSMVPIGADPAARRRAFAAAGGDRDLQRRIEQHVRRIKDEARASRHALIRTLCPGRLLEFCNEMLRSEPEIEIEVARLRLLGKLQTVKRMEGASFADVFPGRSPGGSPYEGSSGRAPAPTDETGSSVASGDPATDLLRALHGRNGTS